jgi:hypothetical protein
MAFGKDYLEGQYDNIADVFGFDDKSSPLWSIAKKPSYNAVDEIINQRKFGNAMNGAAQISRPWSSMTPGFDTMAQGTARRAAGQGISDEALEALLGRKLNVPGVAERAGGMYSKAQGVINSGMTHAGNMATQGAEYAGKLSNIASTQGMRAAVGTGLKAAGGMAMKALPWVGGALLAGEVVNGMMNAGNNKAYADDYAMQMMARDVIEGKSDYNASIQGMTGDQVNRFKAHLQRMSQITNNIAGGR